MERITRVLTMAALWLGSAPVAAQNVIDLKEWRAEPGDNPAWAAPNFDDSKWRTTQLPRAGRVPLGLSWLRRQANATADPRGLAVAIGALSHCTDVYLNGHLLGGSGCGPGVDPPYFSPRVMRIPDGWLAPGQPFVLAMRIEGRSNTSWATTAPGALSDEGPYLLGPVDDLERAAELARLRMERRVAIPNSLLGWNSLGAGLLLMALWLRNRTRWELWWFACFQLAIAALNAAQLRSIYQPGSTGGYLPFITLAWICFNLGTYPALFGRPLTWRMSLAIALGIPAGGQLISIAVQFPAMILPVYWATQRLRAGRTTDRILALAIISYALASLNSAAGRLWPEIWPIPIMLTAGNFVISTVASTNGLLSAALVLLLVARLGEDWRQRQKLSAEFEAARTVQRLLLRQPAPAGAWQAEAAYEPASEVGGDFYQLGTRADGGLLLAVGDVSGKGMEAAMVVAVAVGAFRSTPSASPARVLEVMNEALVGLGRSGFVTCCCALLSPDGTVTLANAGHLAPYMDGTEVQTDAGLPLGLAAGVEYAETEVRLGANAIAFLTDGVVEAENTARELFGFDRTREISMKAAQEIADAAKAWGQNDDITVVTVRRNAS